MWSTFGKGDGRLLGVDRVQGALVADGRLGVERDLGPEIGNGNGGSHDGDVEAKDRSEREQKGVFATRSETGNGSYQSGTWKEKTETTADNWLILRRN